MNRLKTGDHFIPDLFLKNLWEPIIVVKKTKEKKI